MSYFDSFGHNSDKYTLDTQCFYYFNSSLMIFSSNKIRCPRFLALKRLFEFVYGLITFYSRYTLSFVAYLSISALISGPHKTPQTLYLPFTLD